MRALNYVIVEADKAYLNDIDTRYGTITINNTLENVSSINRMAKVLYSPKGLILQPGDEIIAHHNIFRLRNGIKGELTPSNYLLEGNKYIVPPTEVFMYKRDSEWQAVDPFCFVEPIPAEEKMIDGIYLSSLEFEDNTHKGNIIHQGVMRFPNRQLRAMGIEEGDHIIFSKWSEYEFTVGDKLYYKMSTKDILGKI